MRTALLAFVALGMGTMLVGCQSSTDSTSQTSDGASTSSEFTLVTLKVPNMT